MPSARLWAAGCRSGAGTEEVGTRAGGEGGEHHHRIRGEHHAEHVPQPVFPLQRLPAGGQCHVVQRGAVPVLHAGHEQQLAASEHDRCGEHDQPVQAAGQQASGGPAAPHRRGQHPAGPHQTHQAEEPQERHDQEHRLPPVAPQEASPQRRHVPAQSESGDEDRPERHRQHVRERRPLRHRLPQDHEHEQHAEHAHRPVEASSEVLGPLPPPLVPATLRLSDEAHRVWGSG